MGMFDQIKGPVFLKESSGAVDQLEQLRAIELLLNEEGKQIIRQDIRCLEYGIAGEKNIEFELKNSHMPMCVLHDVYLECEGLSAQIDYMVFTKKICFVIECKNLYGNIEINNSGDFIRTLDFGGRIRKEGIYSPITQNQRHLELMKKIKLESSKNLLVKMMADKWFGDFNKPLVVLANPKTVLYAKYAKKEVKEKVIRADQLIEHIKKAYRESKSASDSEEKMIARANAYLKLHREVKRDYTEKYNKYKKAATAGCTDKAKANEDSAEMTDIEDTEMFKKLKAYRLMKSREEKIKPYYIYNNMQLKDVILKMPKNKSELLSVEGFGEAKANKYGEDIIKMLWE